MYRPRDALPASPTRGWVRGRWPQHSLRSARHWFAAAPAAANGNAGHGNGRAEAQVGSNSGQQAGAATTPASPAPPAPTGGSVQGTATASPQGNGGVNTQAGASAGSQPGGHTGTQAGATTHGQAGRHAGTQADATTHGQAGRHADATARGQAGRHAGTQADTTTQGQAGRHAGTQADVTARGRAARHAGTQAGATTPGQAGGHGGATTRSQADGHTAKRTRETDHGNAGTHRQTPVGSNSQAHSNPRADENAGARSGAGRHAQAQAAGSSANTEARAAHDGNRGHVRSGGRGFSDVRVTAPERPEDGPPTAHVKVSHELDAAIRAEARAAAREEVRERFRSNETVNGARTRFVTKGTAGRRVGVRYRQSATAETAAALLSMLETAWERGGPARVHALLELCLRHETSTTPSAPMMPLREQAGTRGRANGRNVTSGHAVGAPHDAMAGRPAHARDTSDHAHLGGAPVDSVPDAHGQGSANGQAGPAGTVGDHTAGANGQSTFPSAQADDSGGRRDQGNATAPSGGAENGAIVAAPATPATQPPSATSPISESRVGPATEQSGRAPVDGGPERLLARGPIANEGTSGASRALSAARNSAAMSSRQLPFTGADLPVIALLGAAAVAAGAMLRRRSALTAP